MLIQKELEQKIMDAVSTALSSASVDADVSGSWATSSSGLVKWVESGDSAAIVNVSVACPSWETYSTPLVSFGVNLTLFIRPELDAQGTALCAVSEVVEDLLRGWQTATYQNPFTALDLDNLSVDGVALGGGNSPTLENGVCSVTWNFTLSGSYVETANSTAN